MKCKTLSCLSNDQSLVTGCKRTNNFLDLEECDAINFDHDDTIVLLQKYIRLFKSKEEHIEISYEVRSKASPEIVMDKPDSLEVARKSRSQFQNNGKGKKYAIWKVTKELIE